MTPAQMSALHHAAFEISRGWSAQEITELLDSPYTTALTQTHGFALVRTLAGESELLTLAVDPKKHRCGIARTLMRDWFTTIKASANTAFLEVAADNHAARALYAGFGFETAGIRHGYYARRGAPSVDALLLRAAVTSGQSPE